MSFLEVTDIRKSFGSTEVLQGINFSLEKGEVLSIIGSSGSGKTTLLRCLNLLESVDCGTVYVNGEEMICANKRYTDKEIREKRLHMGLVFQQFNLFPQYNVLDNLTLAPVHIGVSELRAKKVKNFFIKVGNLFRKLFRKNKKELLKIEKTKAQIVKEATDKAYELLRRVGLEEKAKSYPCEISGGQQQRVAIARALMLNPNILCFDEPTSALDPELTGEVLKVIKGLKSGDHTMLIVTHEMEFAKNVSDKVIFMADGVIEEMGTPQEVFDNPKSPKLIAFLNKANEII